jgi:hypothetical protein
MLERDVELLSAYLDNALSNEERAALEARFAADADLRRELERLRLTKNLIGALPVLRPPRPLTITREMVAPPRILVFPATVAFSAISAAAAIILLLAGAILLSTGREHQPTADIAHLPTLTATISTFAGGGNLYASPTLVDDVMQTGVYSFAPSATLPPIAAATRVIEEEAEGLAAQAAPAPEMLTATLEQADAAADAAPSQRLLASPPPTLTGLANNMTETPDALELAPMAAMALTDTPTPMPTQALPPSPMPTQPLPPSPAPSPTVTPSPTPPAPGAPLGDGSSVGVALIVLAALLFLLAAAAFLRRGG